MVAEKLAIIDTFKDGIEIGLKNLVPILVNVLLWLLTCWIPYLNVGKTIGLSIGIVSKASRGETISMYEIFDPRYRKYMGEYFITMGLVYVGVCAGLVFGIIPGIVIGIAWCLTALLLIDKGKNPTEAITLSNNLTYGFKWNIFFLYFAVTLVFSLLAMLFMLIPVLGHILLFALFVILLCVCIGIQASIYRQLTEEVVSSE